MVNRTYNKEKIYENEIKEELQKLKALCVKYDIPFLATFAVANDEKTTTYINDGITLGMLGLRLTDDKMSKYICVNNGFDVKVPGVENDEGNFDNIGMEEFDDSIEPIPEELL
mgnify:CR=1 FL=1